MRRCAIYARYSTDPQSPTSIEDQVRLLTHYAERHELAVAATFEDAALSGASVAGRVGYQQLMAEALSPRRPFDVVLVEDLSRLTRELGETDTMYRRFRLRGVDLVGVSDGIDTSRKGAAMQIGIKGLMNSLYLEDLAEKTHRGLAGRVERGLTAGGRLYGYRVVEGRLEPDKAMAAVVRRIWREYAEGRSPRKIAHRLNDERIPFPSQDTKRGPARKGWTASTVRAILMNETYCGKLIWNRSKFVKDPDTGRRRRVPRQLDEWKIDERPELRIIAPDLERAVKARLECVGQAYGSRAQRGRKWIPVGRATVAYPSRHLMSGMLRCAECHMAMVAQIATRRKGEHTYQYAWYRCAGAKDKGPALCRHDVWYRKDHLEGALLKRLHEATATPEKIAQLAELVNARVEAAARGRGARAEALAAEIAGLERQARNLLRLVADDEAASIRIVRDELRQLDGELERRRAELEILETARQAAPAQAHPAWIRKRLEHLGELLASDPVRARVEILKHLDGPLQIRPLPAPAGQRAAEIIGHLKPNSLLAVDQEAVCLRMVAGAGFEPATFGL